jgi:hypothetical protein
VFLGVALLIGAHLSHLLRHLFRIIILILIIIIIVIIIIVVAIVGVGKAVCFGFERAGALGRRTSRTITFRLNESFRDVCARVQQHETQKYYLCLFNYIRFTLRKRWHNIQHLYKTLLQTKNTTQHKRFADRCQQIIVAKTQHCQILDRSFVRLDIEIVLMQRQQMCNTLQRKNSINASTKRTINNNNNIHRSTLHRDWRA